MTRKGLLLLVLGSPAAAQVPSSPSTRILFQSKWDAHHSQVRIRPAGDTSAAWVMRTARRYDARTFEVIPGQRDSLFANPSASWTIEARVPQSQHDKRAIRGALVGGAIGSAAVIVNAVTCKRGQGEGPGCAIVLVAAGLGGTLAASLRA